VSKHPIVDKHQLLVEAWRKYAKSGHVNEGFIDSVKSAMGLSPRDTTRAKLPSLPPEQQDAQDAPKYKKQDILNFMLGILDKMDTAYATEEDVTGLANAVYEDLLLDEAVARQEKKFENVFDYLADFHDGSSASRSPVFDDLKKILVKFLRKTEFKLSSDLADLLGFGSRPTNESLYNFWQRLAEIKTSVK